MESNVSAKMAARILHISEEAVRKRCRSGTWDAHKRGNEWCIPRTSLYGYATHENRPQHSQWGLQALTPENLPFPL
jgi:hypothetical protein